MKTILLLRHGKAANKAPGARDFDRPLAPRGVADSELIGKFIRQEGIIPDLIISSPAKRAKQTAELVRNSAGLTTELRLNESIYEASRSQLLEVLATIEDTANTIMLVGHNPGFEELLRGFIDEARNLSTAALASIELTLAAWSNAPAARGNLKWLVTPKDLTSNQLD